MSDGRAKRSPSPDGQGVARRRLERAWDAYYGAVRPFTDPLSAKLSPLLMPIARAKTRDEAERPKAAAPDGLYAGSIGAPQQFHLLCGRLHAYGRPQFSGRR